MPAFLLFRCSLEQERKGEDTKEEYASKENLERAIQGKDMNSDFPVYQHFKFRSLEILLLFFSKAL